MPRPRPAYAPELRQKLVDLARSGRSVGELARQREPVQNTVRVGFAKRSATDVYGPMD